MDELEFSAKYPFLDMAKKTILEIQLNEKIVDMALERIKKALNGEITPRIFINETDKKEWIASFAAARMILANIHNSYLTNRFAVIESKIARIHIDKEDERELNIVGARFGINTTNSGQKMVLDLAAYLKNSPRSNEYRLINRVLLKGAVELKESEKKRLIEEAVKKYIESLPQIKDPPQIITAAASKLIIEIPEQKGTTITIKVENHPPCITKLLEGAKKHENLPHQARFYLATYLFNINTTEDELTKIYSNLPDFNERTTRYQAGQIKKKGYSVPACATIMTYGLCCAVCKIGNPLNWHKLGKTRKEEIINGAK